MNPILSNAMRLDPFPWYSTMRQAHPVAYDPRQSSWSVFRYDHVQRVLSDYVNFSSERLAGNTQSVKQPFGASMISADPPRHRQLRSLVTQAFTPRAIDALAPRITAIVEELLNNLSAGDTMDVIQDLGYPLPVVVIAELLGVPADDREHFKQWSDAVVSFSNTGEMPHYQAIQEMSS